MYKFGTRSYSNLVGVHPDLVKVMEEAIHNSPHDFSITEGLRTATRQQRLVDEGKSKTLNSRHLTGHAVDIVVLDAGKANWEFAYYKEVADHIKKVAAKNGVALVWGGDWVTFKDGPHFELDRKVYA